MIVVADTSPLNYLVQLGVCECLQQLYGEIYVPREVLIELQAMGTPSIVYKWSTELPSWVHVRDASPMERPELNGLDRGEQAAISLALEIAATTILLDERKARRIVREHYGMRVTGTLGVLRDAHIAGFVDGALMFEHLCSLTNFHHTPELETAFMSSIKP